MNISRTENNFSLKRKTLKLCLNDYIFRSKIFRAKVNFNDVPDFGHYSGHNWEALYCGQIKKVATEKIKLKKIKMKTYHKFFSLFKDQFPSIYKTFFIE